MNIITKQTAGNPQFTLSYFQALLTYNNTMRGVMDLDYKWLETWNFAKSISPMSYATNDPEGKFHRMIRKRVVNNATVQSNALAAPNLTVNFTDATYSGFRQGDVLFDDQMNFGRVISVSPGQVVLEPHFQPATLAVTEFAAGSTVYKQSDASGNFWTEGKTNLFAENDVQTDYVAVQRDSHATARREKIQTFFGNTGTVAYTWTREEADMVQRALKDYTVRFWVSEVGTKNSSYQGPLNSTRGVRRSIIDDGAAYLNGTSAITQNTFEDMIMAVAEVKGGSFQKALKIKCGRQAYRAIANFYPDQLAFSGSKRTAEGQDYDLNVARIRVAGIACDIEPMQWMGDSEVVPDWFSHSVYIMDLDPIPFLDRPGSVSPLIRCHFGSEDEDRTIYKVVGGMTGPGTGNDTGKVMLGGYELTQSSIDGYHYEILMDNGISYVANCAALYEWIH